MCEMAYAANNAESPEQLAAILDVVSDVLGVPALAGRCRLLEAEETTLQHVIDAMGIAGALSSLYLLAGGPAMPELYERIQKVAPNRKVDVHFEARRDGLPTIQHITGATTPNEALPAIVEDSKREVPDPKPFRWWIEERWMTREEWEQRGCPDP